jgi:hypothetical protein
LLGPARSPHIVIKRAAEITVGFDGVGVGHVWTYIVIPAKAGIQLDLVWR